MPLSTIFQLYRGGYNGEWVKLLFITYCSPLSHICNI